MRVILKDNIENLGQIGDLVSVSDGYARNFLLPRKMVVVANEHNVKEIEHHKRILEKKRKAQHASAEEFVKQLEEHSCTIKRKVGKNDKLYGSVTANDIADELKSAGFEVKKSTVRLGSPIRTLGVHPVEIRLLPDVSATVKVWVVKEEE